MKRFLISAIILCALLTPAIAHAEDVVCDSGRILPPCTCEGDCQLTDFVELFINLYSFGLHIAAPLATFFIIIGSVILVTASGYAPRIEMGKTMILQAVTGLIIVLISWVIVDTTIFLLTGNKDRTVFNKPWFGGFTYVCSANLLKIGCVGGNVTNLQGNLATLGYSVNRTNTYDQQTADAVEDFHSDFNSRVLVESRQLACGGTPEGALVWNSVFRPSCAPSGPCSVTPQQVEQRLLPTSSAADKKTLDAIKDLIPIVSNEFNLACQT